MRNVLYTKNKQFIFFVGQNKLALQTQQRTENKIDMRFINAANGL